MLVRRINIETWLEGYYAMKRFHRNEAIVAEHYVYEISSEESVFDEPVHGVWIFAILTIEDKPVMVTSFLGPDFAWRSQSFLLDHLRNNPNAWVDQDDSTLTSAPVPRRVILTDLVERAVLEQELLSLDSVRPLESSLPPDCRRDSTPSVASAQA